MPNTLHVGAPSLFVTLTAWAAIVLAALVSVLAGLQQAEVASLLPQWKLMPLRVVSRWLLAYLPWVLGAATVLSLLLAAAAVGLLLRLNWARRVFIALAATAIGANLLGLWLQHEVVQALVLDTLQQGGLPARAAGMFGSLAAAAQAMAALVALGGCALLGWVIRRLMSERVRQEFA